MEEQPQSLLVSVQAVFVLYFIDFKPLKSFSHITLLGNYFFFFERCSFLIFSSVLDFGGLSNLLKSV